MSFCHIFVLFFSLRHFLYKIFIRWPDLSVFSLFQSRIFHFSRKSQFLLLGTGSWKLRSGPQAVLMATRVLLLLGPLCSQSQKISVCILNHVYTDIYNYSCIYLQTYKNKHEFILISLIPMQYDRICFSLPLLFICNFILKQ